MLGAPIIRVKNLCTRYGEEIILDNITFDVFKGEIVAIIGTSGCGKSTLLKNLIGLLRPYSGSILLKDIDITSCDDNTLQAVFRNVGVLFQGSALFGAMTLAENIALPILEHTELPKDIIGKLVHMKLCKFELAAYEAFMPSELSGGMKKRAGLARAMALNPELLFLDEPTTGLDPIKSSEINELIKDINRISHTTIIIVTHALKTIFHIADRVLMIDKDTKGIIAEGSPETLLQHSRLAIVRRFLKNGDD